MRECCCHVLHGWGPQDFVVQCSSTHFLHLCKLCSQSGYLLCLHPRLYWCQKVVDFPPSYIWQHNPWCFSVVSFGSYFEHFRDGTLSQSSYLLADFVHFNGSAYNMGAQETHELVPLFQPFVEIARQCHSCNLLHTQCHLLHSALSRGWKRASLLGHHSGEVDSSLNLELPQCHTIKQARWGIHRAWHRVKNDGHRLFSQSTYLQLVKTKMRPFVNEMVRTHLQYLRPTSTELSMYSYVNTPTYHIYTSSKWKRYLHRRSAPKDNIMWMTWWNVNQFEIWDSSSISCVNMR